MNYWIWLSAIGMVVLVFLITLIPSHDAFGVLYVLVLVLIAERCTIKTLRMFAALCLVLECSAFLIVHYNENFGEASTRLALSVTATLIVTLITERSKRARDALEKQSRILAQADHIKTIGQMGIALAHEVNQPLSSITTFAHSGTRWLQRPQPNINEALACLSQIDTNATRAADIIYNIREMSKGKKIERHMVLDLKKLIQEAVSIVRLGEHAIEIEFYKTTNGRTIFIRGNRTEIQQLIINLLLNAIESTKKSFAKSKKIKIMLAHAEEEPFIEIKLIDYGTGFIENNIETYFEPFYTTKDSGMGMGLSICRTIVEAHHGTIKADNLKPCGAVITVHLPIVRALP